jgi:hypothetical protein
VDARSALGASRLGSRRGRVGQRPDHSSVGVPDVVEFPSIRVRRCAPEIRLLGEGWQCCRPLSGVSDGCTSCRVSPAGRCVLNPTTASSVSSSSVEPLALGRADASLSDVEEIIRAGVKARRPGTETNESDRPGAVFRWGRRRLS